MIDSVTQTNYIIYSTRIIENHPLALIGTEKGLYFCKLTKDNVGNYIDTNLLSLSDNISDAIWDILTYRNEKYAITADNYGIKIIDISPIIDDTNWNESNASIKDKIKKIQYWNASQPVYCLFLSSNGVLFMGQDKNIIVANASIENNSVSISQMRQVCMTGSVYGIGKNDYYLFVLEYTTNYFFSAYEYQEVISSELYTNFSLAFQV